MNESDPSSARHAWQGRIVLWIVALYAAAIYLPFLGSGRSLTTHEGFVTVPALQALERGEWLIPRYVAWVWVEKPPLVIWCTALSFLIFGGFSELAARLPAAMSAIGLCVLLAWLALRHFGPVVALLSGLIQATCVYSFLQGRLGEVDFPFTFLIAACHAILAYRWSTGDFKLPLGASCAFHALLGLAVLTKGPLALGFVGGTVLLWSVLRRDARPLFFVIASPGVICGILIALSWHVWVVVELGSYALDRWLYNYLDRFTGEHRLGTRSVFYYFWTIPYLMLPWSLVLLAGWKRLREEARGASAKPVQFLWVWFIAGLVIVTLSSGKSKHYCMPALPPLSILAAQCLAPYFQSFTRSVLYRYIGIFGVAALMYAAAGGLLIPYLDHWRGTADFVRQVTARIPRQSDLVVVGLGHSPVYPYINRPYRYVDSMNDLAILLETSPEQGVWILALRDEAVREARVRIEPAETEAPRPRHRDALRLICGVARRAPDGELDASAQEARESPPAADVSIPEAVPGTVPPPK